MQPSTSEQKKSGHTVREAVGVFHDAASFDDAVHDLLSCGFDRDEISLLASDDAVTAKLGHIYSSVEELEDDPDVERAAYVGDDAVDQEKAGVIGGLALIGTFVAIGAVVATGGTLAALVLAAGAGGGAGGVFGSAVAKHIENHHADYINEQMAKGGLLLWVNTRDAEREQLALDVLNRHGAKDAHVHDLEASHGSAG